MPDPIRKSFSVVSKAIDAEAGIFEAMITTESTDRVGDIVRAAGAQVENYLKNPVVLWAHDYGAPPIGKTLSLEIIPDQGIKGRWQFADWGANPQADIVRRLWSAGFLNAISIGFIPIKSINLDAKDNYGWGPKEYVEWELLEYSCVPVPANQDALRLAIKTLATPVETKRGRVLSAANERKIREAVASLSEVLDQIAQEEPTQEQLPGPTPDNPGEPSPTIDPTPNDASDARLDQAINYLDQLKEIYHA